MLLPTPLHKIKYDMAQYVFYCILTRFPVDSNVMTLLYSFKKYKIEKYVKIYD